ncbi:hypothetical protein, partial [Nocardia farcinica]|uniref:hypothetical protein n=1 Tax=Nocardia farcinica TaxID=37329 RepID=UPI0034DABC1D
GGWYCAAASATSRAFCGPAEIDLGGLSHIRVIQAVSKPFREPLTCTNSPLTWRFDVMFSAA